ncbi:o-succinylbenzoate synthase [Ktedonobacter racemifer]|uniref:o-succinylbenzoate synthase n=1 Tax=Ktedonobacter racemifer DSM 44963 TaxID=485913 RepID=D6TM01_KTERA|nr:o-succinylbenzoate synthase [Ktedonobacter racemifer]EFH86801.1 o-succinylbenzoic acid (OSB) synthetase [Ktedonobacter racemifer DSM 44963]
MQVQAIDLHPYRIPMPGGFTTAHGTFTQREGCLIKITISGGIIGLGEAAPLPDFGGATFAETYAALNTLRDQLLQRDCVEAVSSLYPLLEEQRYPASALYGLECALLDAWGQHEGMSLHTLLAPAGTQPRANVAVNTVIGAATTKAVTQAAQKAIQAGFDCLKLKMGLSDHPEEEIKRVAAVRAAIGPKVHLRLDANEKWSLEQAATILEACTQYDIQYVEQPLRAFDLEGMYQLRQRVAIPLAADEAVYDLASARRLLDLQADLQAADVLIIKPQLVGGLYPARSIIQTANAAGMRCVLTSSLEAGISLAATLHLAAASPEVTMECGLATLALLEDDLLINQLTIRGGLMPVPTAPGLGVQLDQAALARYTFMPSQEEVR